MSSESDHGHAAQVAAYGRCVACTAAAASPPAPSGREARDDALLAVETGAPLSWLIDARHIIRRLADAGTEFTSDDVWAELLHPPEPRALGAAIRGEATAGRIVNTGRTRPSTRPDCHARPLTIWRGPQAVHDVVDEPTLWP